jgi:hypothetical protein
MPTFTDPAGIERMLGDLGFSTTPNRAWNKFGTSEETKLVKRSDWQLRDGISDRPAIGPTRIKNQGQTNECNAFAICYAMEAVRRVSGGSDIPLSPGYIYGNINYGHDNGSLLEDGLAWVLRNGTVPANVVAELEWRVFPPNAPDIAQNFRVLEWWLCPTFEEMGTAVQYGFPVVFGIPWGPEEAIDNNGWLPDDPAGGVAGGHAMCAMGVVKKGQNWGLLTINSWGEGWGRNGWHIVPERRFKNQMFGGGAWACRVVTVED